MEHFVFSSGMLRVHGDLSDHCGHQALNREAQVYEDNEEKMSSSSRLLSNA